MDLRAVHTMDLDDPSGTNSWVALCGGPDDRRVVQIECAPGRSGLVTIITGPNERALSAELFVVAPDSPLAMPLQSSNRVVHYGDVLLVVGLVPVRRVLYKLPLVLEIYETTGCTRNEAARQALLLRS